MKNIFTLIIIFLLIIILFQLWTLNAKLTPAVESLQKENSIQNHLIAALLGEGNPAPVNKQYNPVGFKIPNSSPVETESI